MLMSSSSVHSWLCLCRALKAQAMPPKNVVSTAMPHIRYHCTAPVIQKERSHLRVKSTSNACMPAERTGRGSLLDRLSSPPDDPIGQGTELNAFMNYLDQVSTCLVQTRHNCIALFRYLKHESVPSCGNVLLICLYEVLQPVWILAFCGLSCRTVLKRMFKLD